MKIHRLIHFLVAISVFALFDRSSSLALTPNHFSRSNISTLLANRNSAFFQLIQDSVEKEKRKLREIQVLCPPSNNGALVVISRNARGAVKKYEVEYRNNVAVGITIAFDKDGKGFKTLALIDMINSNDSDEVNMGYALAETGNTVFKDACNGTKASRNRFQQLLQANKKLLGISPTDFISNF